MNSRGGILLHHIKGWTPDPRSHEDESQRPGPHERDWTRKRTHRMISLWEEENLITDGSIWKSGSLWGAGEGTDQRKAPVMGWAMLYSSVRGRLQEWTHSPKLANLPAGRPEGLTDTTVPQQKNRRGSSPGWALSSTARLSRWQLCWLPDTQDVRVWGPWKPPVQVALTIRAPCMTLWQVDGTPGPFSESNFARMKHNAYV